MKERNAFEILQDYPKEKGLIFETHESNRHFYLTPNDPTLNTKYVIFEKDSLIFFANDSFATKAFMNQTFTGLYSISNLENDFECEINKKDWLDNFRRNKRKTGNKNIIGIETNQWIYKSEEIDILLNLGGEIIKKLNKTSG